MVLEVIAAMAIAGSCPSSVPASDQWGIPEWNKFCGDSAYHECLAAIESRMIEAADGAVVRAGNTLHFRIGSGDEFSLRDDRAEPFASVSYRYWGQFGSYYLVRLQFYEGSWFGLLHKDTGRLTKVIRGGLPVISPSHEWMVSASQGPYGQRGTIVDVWRAADDGFEPVLDVRFDSGEFGTPWLRWIDSARVDVCWRGEETHYLGSLQLEHDEWVRVGNEE